ncbi:phage head-tail joining protein [Teredinibacter purpureus]|uniref:phage head-tail joining protein n=1 Tax=Teredinibacter purpureus TaxID=2731756 RepID=UPI0005F822AE|nr:hypothetical protein [Teredinibacter purpureus]
MAVTQQDINDLEKAIYSGARKAKRGDREIEYRDLGEMRRTLSAMKSELSGSKPKPLMMGFNRGYQ